MIQTRPTKSLYSENEAAAEVGVSVDELRSLVRKIAGGGGSTGTEEPVEDVKGAMYQPRDLVLLKLYMAGVRTSVMA
jgi:hypothetical protein